MIMINTVTSKLPNLEVKQILDQIKFITSTLQEETDNLKNTLKLIKNDSKSSEILK